MTTMKIAPFFLPFLLGACLAQSHTTSHRTNPSPTKPVPAEAIPPEPQFLTSPFDGKIVRHFKGHNLKLIFDAWDDSVPQKSEFETTEQYKSRIAAIHRTLPWGMERGSDLAFVFDPDNVTFLYDADTAKFRVGSYIRSERNSHNVDDTLLSPEWTTHSTHRNYTAHNSFGASVDVTETDVTGYGLSIDRAKWPGWHDGWVEPKQSLLSFSVPLDKAADLKPRLRLAVIGNIDQSRPWAVYRDYKEPTMDSPVDGATVFNYLRLVPKQLLVYDYETGDVLLHFDIAQPNPGISTP